MPKLTILRGVSGSGKSTYAAQQSALVVSRDALRLALFGSNDQDYYDENVGDKESTVSLVQDATIKASLDAGQDVILDNTNVEWKFVISAAKIAYGVGAEVEIKTFDVPLVTAKMRNRERAARGGRHVPESIIENQHQRLQGTKNRALDSQVVPRPYTGTPGKPKAFIFDLDGTTYHMNNKRGPYDHNVDVDDPDEIIQSIVRAQSEVLIPIGMSGRKEITRERTEFSLKRDGVPFKQLLMRADGDNRADHIVKAELFDNHIRDNFDVQFVLDDRWAVVETWRAMGLKCLQVQPGDF